MKFMDKLKNAPFRYKFFYTAFCVLLTYVIINQLTAMGIINRYYSGIIMSCCINIILVVSLNITTGFLGQLTLGHAGFMAVGAYGSAWISKTFTDIPMPFSFIIALLFGATLALLFGFLVSIPALRLRGDYIAIITLAFGEMVRNVLLNMPVLGGAQGYIGIPLNTNFTWAFFLTVITVVAAYFLINSRQGRAIMSIREDEIAAESTGVNTSYFKVLAFVFAAFFAGLAGGIYAHYLGILVPGTFSFTRSIDILVMVVLGGMGNIKGSIIAAIILTLLPEMLRETESYRTFIFALILIVFMLTKYNPKVQSYFQTLQKKLKMKGVK